MYFSLYKTIKTTGFPVIMFSVRDWEFGGLTGKEQQGYKILYTKINVFKWDDRIEIVCSKLTSSIYPLKSLPKYCPAQVLTTALCYTHISLREFICGGLVQIDDSKECFNIKKIKKVFQRWAHNWRMNGICMIGLDIRRMNLELCSLCQNF